TRLESEPGSGVRTIVARGGQRCVQADPAGTQAPELPVGRDVAAQAGRAPGSSRLGEPWLPKRVSLPVFASDALSSVAYAPDEVFIMLSLAGASAYIWSWKISIAVAGGSAAAD